ncbi:hypothetical protein HTS88_12235 [Pseudarthrobacter oxydans]|uniref:hypothetical protein n=1 Tax=Pseudarthrobacter oxydans TaxID=1671 RepID=UPI0015738165|nr:hypothetical protein [Pseudarthrobacter oxydans]NSX37167.1 hypothetical protein [Pseudarthrobacter oxydans]
MSPDIRRPWTFAAVCVMVPALPLLVFSLADPIIQLLPWYAAVYLLIGACIFGPVGKLPPLRQAVAFLLPGALLVGAGLLDLGFWAGGWLLGLPAWGLLLSRWTPENPLPAVQLLKFLGLLLLGMALFTFNATWVIFSLTVFLLPAIPLLRLARRSYKDGQLQAAVEVLLSVAAVVVAVALPTPAGSWSSPWMHAGGAATAGLMMVFWAGFPRHSGPLKLKHGAIV